MNQDLTYIIVTMLVPLIPAYIIYRTLPSQTVVRGPFKGLQVQLGGAFGGYFLLVLCIFGFITMRQRAFTIYTVEGKIPLKSAQDSADISLYLSPSAIDGLLKGMGLSPSASMVLSSGDFIMKIPIENGKSEIPSLVITYPRYESACIKLPEDNNFHPHLNWKENKITIQTPVEMVPANDAPYQPDESLIKGGN